MKVTLAKSVLAKWRRVALRAFPREVYGFLLGRVSESGYEVEEVWVPRPQNATPSSVDVEAHWYLEACERAAEGKRFVIGSIHTHPYTTKLAYDPVPSLGDMASHSDWELVVAVTNVWGPGRSGKKTCGTPAFFTNARIVELEVS